LASGYETDSGTIAAPAAATIGSASRHSVMWRRAGGGFGLVRPLQ
jgi:hypothetical protein